MSLPNTNITVGAPPLLWSDVNEAFTRINENFDSIAASLGVAGITPINFETLDTSLKPTVDNLYELGDITHKWRSVYTGEFTTVDSLNGLWAGNAQIKGIGFTVNLPANSTIGGDPITGIGTSLIIDPDKTFFKFIQIDNNESIAATEFGDTVNLLSGNGISMNVNSGADSITIENTGILNMLSGSGINVSTTSGVSTVTNTGVRSLTNVTALPAGRTSGAGINISAGTGDNINITNTGILSAVGGIGIAAQVDSDTGLLTITNSAPAVNAFAQIEINGDSGDRISADLVSDVLSINSGLGITLTKNTGTDTLTIAVNPTFNLTGDLLGNVTGNVLGNVTGNVLGNTTGYHVGDVKGSIFADDSTIIVDATDNKIYSRIFATTLRTSEIQIALGNQAGETSQGYAAVAVGSEAGTTSQGSNAVALGPVAGNLNQGGGAVSVGSGAGLSNQGAIAVAIGQQAGETTQGSAGVAIGYFAGKQSQGAGAVGIGYTTAQVTQGEGAVSIGWSAGQTNQGAYSIALGFRAGFVNQDASSIILNASGAALNSTGAGFYVSPVRNQTGTSGVVQYNASTSEISFSSSLGAVSGTFTGNVFTNLIDSADSSAITVTPITIFSSDVIVENDLNVTQRFLLRGSRVINLTELKSIVADSTDFADFKIRIASLV